MTDERRIDPHLRNGVLLLGFTAIIQSGHMVEHIVQLIQWSRRMSLSHGIIGQLDLELVHFIFDALFLIGLSALGSFYADMLRAKGPRPYAVFMVAWVVQTYHMVEHVVKFTQHMETGLEGTPGILGRFVPLVPLHFGFNAIVTAAIVTPFFMLGLHRVFVRILVPRPVRRAEA